MKKQKTYFLENITLSELGKRNIQAKRVYSNGKAFFAVNKIACENGRTIRLFGGRLG